MYVNASMPVIFPRSYHLSENHGVYDLEDGNERDFNYIADFI